MRCGGLGLEQYQYRNTYKVIRLGRKRLLPVSQKRATDASKPLSIFPNFPSRLRSEGSGKRQRREDRGNRVAEATAGASGPPASLGAAARAAQAGPRADRAAGGTRAAAGSRGPRGARLRLPRGLAHPHAQAARPTERLPATERAARGSSAAGSWPRRQPPRGYQSFSVTCTPLRAVGQR